MKPRRKPVVEAPSTPAVRLELTQVDEPLALERLVAALAKLIRRVDGRVPPK